MKTFIEIIEPISFIDDEGFSRTDDNILASLRAYKEEKNSSEAWKNRAEFTSSNVLFRIRRPSFEIKTNMVVVDEKGCYEIKSIRDIGSKKMYLEILAESVVPSGKV